MYDFDPYGYQDQVEDRAAQVETIAADLDSGNAEYITDYLKEIVQEQGWYVGDTGRSTGTD